MTDDDEKKRKLYHDATELRSNELRTMNLLITGN